MKNEIVRFTCFWSKETHAEVKIHATMQYQTMNSWVLAAIFEKLERERKYMLEHR
jgi:predicted HicB family RNase H-like nuclease